MLDNQVPATLSGSGQYMMIYTDNSTSAENTAQKERVLGLFQDFTANKREGPFSRTPQDCGACFFLCPGPCI